MPAENRRLSDKIIEAFVIACSLENLEAAEQLYSTLEFVLTRDDGPDRRRNVAFIAEAADRLARLRTTAKLTRLSKLK